jgi:hypothetical protein
MFTGVLITGLVMGSLNTIKTFEAKTTPDICQKYLTDTAHLRHWMINFESLTNASANNNYKLTLNNGKGQKGNFDLEIRSDSSKHNLVYELNNRGSKLEINFNFDSIKSGTRLLIEHEVKGKGIANKLVIAMLHKSLKKQYELETKRIKALLEQSEINLIDD